MSRQAAWRGAGWLLAAASLTLLVLYPLFELLSAAGELGIEGIRLALARPGTAAAVLNTLWTSAAVTVAALLIGTAGALVTERSLTPGRRWLRVGMVLPLLVPPFVSALAWVRAYAGGGLIDRLLGLSLPGLFGPAGIVAVMAVHAAPLVYLVVAAALASREEPDLELAARSSGAGPLRTLTGVTLPLLAPALGGGAALAFVSSVNAFGIPAVLGLPAGFRTVTTRIYEDFARSARPESFSRAILLAGGLVLLALLVVGASDRFLSTGKGAVRSAAPAGSVPSHRPRLWPAAAAWLYLGLTAGLPLTALALAASTRAVGLAPVPANLTLANFEALVGGRYLEAGARSLGLAVAAATLVLGLGGVMTALQRPHHSGLGTVALLTFSVPGSALAVAMLLAYRGWLGDTLAIILFAYLAKFWALGHRTLAGASETRPPDLARASRVSGAGPLTAFRTVTLPLLRPAVAAAWSLVFLFALHELTMSSLLYGPGTDTLAVAILNLQQLGDVTVVSALAVALTLPVLVAGLAVLVPTWGRRG